MARIHAGSGLVPPKWQGLARCNKGITNSLENSVHRATRRLALSEPGLTSGTGKTVSLRYSVKRAHFGECRGASVQGYDSISNRAGLLLLLLTLSVSKTGFWMKLSNGDS